MIGFQLKLAQDGVNRLRAVLKDGPQLLQPALLRGMKTVATELERTVKTEKLSGQLLEVRTGNLRRAIFTKVGSTPDRSDAFVVLGVDSRKAIYGPIQEVGGVIRPKRGKFLAIPLAAVKTPRGVARFSARDVIANPHAFGYTGTFFVHNVLMGTTGLRGKKNANAIGNVVPLFAMKTSVTIKGVGYLRSTVRERTAWAREVIRKAVVDGMQKLFPNG